LLVIAHRTAIGLGIALFALAGFAAARAVQNEISTPIELDGVEYVRSRTCVRCHPDHYASWSRTFHRTMTQVAGPEAALGDFDDARYTYAGVTSRFTRDGERFFIETLDTDGAMKRFEVALTVGSRRVQQYVTLRGDKRYRLPLACNIEEGRWFHLNGGFLHADGVDFNNHTALWDANCIFCHNVLLAAHPTHRIQNPDPSRAWRRDMPEACTLCHTNRTARWAADALVELWPSADASRDAPASQESHVSADTADGADAAELVGRSEADANAHALAHRHRVFGWSALFIFLLGGYGLEMLEGLKLSSFVLDSIRREMWTLAHFHGALLGLVNLVYTSWADREPMSRALKARASSSLLVGSILLPLGFFLGGIAHHEGDPGIGILLVPAGAVLLLFAVGAQARASWRKNV
jgi:hypothetical protein